MKGSIALVRRQETEGKWVCSLYGHKRKPHVSLGIKHGREALIKEHGALAVLQPEPRNWHATSARVPAPRAFPKDS